MTTEAKLTALGSALALKEGVPLAAGEGLQFEFPGGCLDLTRHLIDADVMTNPFVHPYLSVDTHGVLVKQAMASFLIT